MNIGPQTTVADIATQYPATIRIFQQHGVDFCCGGQRPLAQVCEQGRINLDVLVRDLESATAARAEEGAANWSQLNLGPLTQAVMTRYHRPLDTGFPRLTQMMDKVLAVHGANHPELADVAHTLVALREDIEPHMMKEERVLFPYVARIEALAAADNALAGSPFGTIENPISVMRQEHEAVGGLLADLRRLTSGYAPPEGACNTYRGLLHGLAELERETHEHIHVENNILFPRAAALETRLLGARRLENTGV